MKEEDLSPAAKKELKKLTPSTDKGGNWFEAYDDMLKVLAGEKISDVKKEERESLDDWRKRRDENAVAVELQAYAKAFLGPDISAAVAKIPTGDFFKWLMKDTGREVALKRFMEFLRYEARECSNSFFGVSSDDDEKRREWIEAQAQARFDTLDHPDVPMSKETAYNIGKSYRAWWQRQQGSPAAAHNAEKKMAVEERHVAMIALLPARNNDSGISKEEWENRASSKGLVESGRTFRRDAKHIMENGLITIQEDGRLRQLRKKRGEK